MRTWILGAITLACLSVGSTAFACPVGNGEGAVRPPRSVVQNVSLQASELLERARSLEIEASSHDAEARALDQEADTLANRARILRSQAALVNVSDRAAILDVADELASRARSRRARADEDRRVASSLRREAQSFRERAVVLVRGGGSGGGWRKIPNPRASESTPLPSERVLTL